MKLKTRLFKLIAKLFRILKKRHKVLCFSCNEKFITNRVHRHNFCSKCWKKYFVRPSGTEYEGMDFTRQIVRIRDNHTCRKCHKIWKYGERRFDIHHLNGKCGAKSRSYDKSSDMSGMITLCHKCHLNLPEVRKKMSLCNSPRPYKQKKYQQIWAMNRRDSQTVHNAL